MVSQATFVSSSGERLVFEVHSKDAAWNAVGGIYMMCGVALNGTWDPKYIGKADSFKDRLCSHDKWDPATILGATHVHALVVPQSAERDRIEKMLIEHFNPPLNVQHRTQPPASIGIGIFAR
jgi:hypothetical protein